MYEPDCPFCVEFRDESEAEYRLYTETLTIRTRTLLATEHFRVLVGLGAFKVGYLLLLPIHHISTFSSLSDELLSEAASLVSQLRETLSNLYGAITIFEHGVVTEDTGLLGRCADHAHMHFMPSPLDLDGILSESFRRIALAGVADLGRIRDIGVDYIYSQSYGRAAAFAIDRRLHSQYVRKLIAQHDGLGDVWDWGAFPFAENMLATITKGIKPGDRK